MTIPEKERDYILERMYPGYGNLVPRDIASRAIFLTCFHEGRGVYNAKTGKNENEVYLDLTHKDEAFLRGKLAGILEIYEKFAGVDPYKNPMKVFPPSTTRWAASGSTTSATPRAPSRRARPATTPPTSPASTPWARSTTSITAPIASAPTRSCPASGAVWPAGPPSRPTPRTSPRARSTSPPRPSEKAEKRAQADYERILKQNQDKKDAENAYRLHQELGDTMLRDVTIERHNKQLEKVLSKLDELDERVKNVKTTDDSPRVNQGAQFVRHLENMLVLARVIAQGAKNRDESRGAHYKPDFPSGTTKSSSAPRSRCTRRRAP